MVDADRPGASLPTRAANASAKSPVEMPFRWRTGISTSRLFDRRAYGGRIAGEYRMRSPSAASRSRTRGWRKATGPMPVMISRSGRWPWRTTRRWPVAVFRSACFARNSATSASTAWLSSARAPLRSISVRESVKSPGWASLTTLVSVTAYHSFIGEVAASNTTTIRRLTPSGRHQLLHIAPAGVPAALAIARSHHSAARMLDGLFMSPLVLPALAFGLAALMLFTALGMSVSPLTLIIGHTVVCVPFVVRTTVAALAQLESTWLESSASLGASALYTFRRITLPTIRPGILAGAFFAFMASFDNVPVSLFLRDARTDMLP